MEVILIRKDKANNGTDFWIERGTKTKGVVSHEQIDTLGPSAEGTSTSVTFTRPTAESGTHYYRVRAYNSDTGIVFEHSNGSTVRINNRRPANK